MATSKNQSNARPLKARFRSWLGRLVIACAWGYPIALVVIYLALDRVGEDWWVTTALLYAPRISFGAPLVVLVPALWLMGRRRLLLTQAVALLVLIFPLMGLVLPGLGGTSSGPSLALMTFNVNSEYEGPATILRHIDAIKPDIVLLQEATWGGPMEGALKTRFPFTESSTQFVIGSRYPILSRTEPEKVLNQGKQRSPRFMRYVIDSPIGKLALYSLHPISPRGSMGIARFRGTLHRIRTGEIWAGDPESDVVANAALRVSQVHYAAQMASQESLPVLLAGDTNLPGASAALRRELGQFSDAFRDAGWGFGYTYPQKYPWLRLDRVMASPSLKFSEFRVGCPAASDHLCVSVHISKR